MRYFLLLLAILSSGVLVGCSGGESDQAAPNGPPPEVVPANPERTKSEGR
jgi:hypothetical protein